jgi:hypothetical protein
VNKKKDIYTHKKANFRILGSEVREEGEEEEEEGIEEDEEEGADEG